MSQKWSSPLTQVLAAILFLVSALLALPLNSNPEVWLDIPELGVRLDGDTTGRIATSNIESFRVIIARQTSEIAYGKIYSSINTESANVVMSVSSRSDSMVCTFDLLHRGGFTLHPGRNSVEIAYFDRRSKIHYHTFVVETPRLKDDPPPHEAPVPTPHVATSAKYAVVVGVSKYQSGMKPSELSSAERDASDFYSWLTSHQGGFETSNVRLLTKETATSKNLRAALFDFLSHADVDDLVVFYFVGDAVVDPNDQGVTEGKSNLYLMTYDTDQADLMQTAISVAELQDLFREHIKARTVITLVEACHKPAGAFAATTGNNNLVHQYLARYAAGDDRSVITASDVSEVADESETWGDGHGVFTYALLDGLNGGADLNHDGKVTIAELFSYVRDHVYKETVGRQHPIVRLGKTSNVVLARTSRETASK